jgi:hypothetical protein
MHEPHDGGEENVHLLREEHGLQDKVKGLAKIAITSQHSISNVFLVESLGYNLLSESIM